MNKYFGDLIRTFPNGEKQILEHAQPWAVLQRKLKEYKQMGYKNLKITHQNENN